jgi:hypothetical protein
MNRRGTIALLTLAVLTASRPAFAGNGPNGVPYAVFDAINELWSAVRAIQQTPGPAGPQGTPGERGLPGEGALRVVDSTGQTVGAFLAQDVPPAGYQHLAVAKAGSQVVFLLVNRNGFRDNYVSFLYHTTPDCTGQRYLAMGNSPYVNPAAIVEPTQPAAVQRGYAIFPDGSMTVEPIASREYFAPGADYRSPGLCEAVSLTTTVAPARGLELATLNVVPPFRIQ